MRCLFRLFNLTFAIKQPQIFIICLIHYALYYIYCFELSKFSLLSFQGFNLTNQTLNGIIKTSNSSLLTFQIQI